MLHADWQRLTLNPVKTLDLPDGANLITVSDRPDGGKVAVIEKPSGGVIRGLHYIGEEGTRYP